MIREVRKKKKKKKKRNSFLKFVLRGRRGGDRNFRPPTHQHASPHITDNYSFRSLRAPIVSGDPRVSDTLWGSPISLPPRSVRATHPVFLLFFPRFHPRCPRFTWMPSSIVPRFFFEEAEEGMDDRSRYIYKRSIF